MLYSIFNLAQNKIIAQGLSQEAVVFFFLKNRLGDSILPWRWQPAAGNKTFSTKTIFISLNMSGKDMAAPDFFYNGGPFIFSSYVLRRYMVFDEEMRIVDPRTWTMVFERVTRSSNPWQFRPMPMKRQRFSNFHIPGRKDHSHRVRMPAMLYQTLRMSQDEIEKDDEDLGEIEIISDHSAIRRKNLEFYSWDCCDKKAFRKTSRSWKDQTRSHAQWGKHQPSCCRRKDQPSSFYSDLED